MRATVVIRTTGRPSLAASLASVVLQRRDDVQVIVIDAIGTLAAIDNIGLPVRWISRHAPLHRSVAAQAGLDAVDTRWALFLDDDDLLLPGHLERLLAALDAAPQAVLAHAGVELIDRDAGGVRGAFDSAFEPWELLLGNRMPIHAALFDAERARAAGAAFDPQLDIYEDWDFWLQLRCLGDFVHVPGISAQYLVGADSSDAQRSAFAGEAYWRVWRKWWPRAPQAWWTRVLEAAQRGDVAGRELRAVREALERHVEELRTMTAVAAERYELIVQLRQSLDETAGALHWTQGQLESTRHDLHATRAELAERSAQLDARSRAHAALQIEQRRTADELQAVLGSTSWRLTRPLRGLGDLARGARRGAGRFGRGLASRQSLFRGRAFRDHQRWIAGAERRDRQQRIAALKGSSQLLLSVLMPVWNPDRRLLDAAVASLLAQVHQRWELCLADDGSTSAGLQQHLAAWARRDSRIRVLHRPHNGGIAACTNSAATLAGGDWLVFVDQDDLLAPHALAEIADAAAQHPDAGWIYSDEDKLDAGGHRFEPHFKPGFSLELLRGQNFVSHLSAVKRTVFEELGGLREGFDGAQDHDLVLRAAERLAPRQFVHVPRVLYHWRAGAGSTAASLAHKPQALEASLRAVAEHLQRSEPAAQVEVLPGLPWHRVRHPLPPAAAAAVFAETPSDTAWAERIAARAGSCRLLRHDGGSAPWLLRLAAGLEPVDTAWLEELAAQLARPGIGVAGGAVHRAGRLAEGALRVAPGANGRALTVAAGVPRGQPGPFGAALLARDADAVTPHAMLIRRELWPLWQQAAGVDPLASAVAFGAAVRAAGWRIVWTPWAAFDAAGPSG